MECQQVEVRGEMDAGMRRRGGEATSKTSREVKGGGVGGEGRQEDGDLARNGGRFVRAICEQKCC